MRQIMTVAIGALALAGCTGSAERLASDEASAQRDLAQALAGRRAGEPRDCISASSVSGPQVVSSRTLLYTEGGRRIWRNDLADSCPGLTPFDTIVAEIHGGQICRNDQFRALEPGTSVPGPYCRLGQFVPYTK